MNEQVVAEWGWQDGRRLQPGLRLKVAAPERIRRAGQARRELFLCTGHGARSQMAESLLAHLSDHTIEASSGGSHPKTLHANPVRVMAERGIDISARTKPAFERTAGELATCDGPLDDLARDRCCP